MDEKGKKMSKSVGNVVDPGVVINGGKVIATAECSLDGFTPSTFRGLCKETLTICFYSRSIKIPWCHRYITTDELANRASLNCQLTNCFSKLPVRTVCSKKLPPFKMFTIRSIDKFL